MTHTLIRDRDQLIVIAYRDGQTLREIAPQFDLTMQRVHQIIQREIPDEMRQPHIVPARRRRNRYGGTA